MKTLDAEEWRLLTELAGPGTEFDSPPCTSDEMRTSRRLIARGLARWIPSLRNDYTVALDITPLGREALRIAKAVRALEGTR